MSRRTYLPHISLLLRSLGISGERLFGASKVAVDTRLLRALIQRAVEDAPFDPSFYCATYPDIDEAFKSGKIPDLARHFVETGYFEGRLGAPPALDESFYVLTYRDVARALRKGEVASAAEHYIRAGAAEGRNPSPALTGELAFWSEVLGLQAG